MKIRFTAPTQDFPFYSNVKVNTGNGWFGVKEVASEGRDSYPAIFPTKEEMIGKVKRLARAA